MRTREYQSQSGILQPGGTNRVYTKIINTGTDIIIKTGYRIYVMFYNDPAGESFNSKDGNWNTVYTTIPTKTQYCRLMIAKLMIRTCPHRMHLRMFW